ncbi:MAG: DsbA family protein [Candidatus Woesearchaeota archaeon]|nr:DsbA family protein [Candidatus Woesearchaeota archaeon]
MKEEKVDLKESRQENLIAFGVVLLIAVVIGYFVYKGMQPPEQEADQRFDLYVGGSPKLGSDNAPVTVIEFSDFECPHCSIFALEHFPQIKEQFIDTGQVRFSYKNFPLTSIHPKALRASLAALCAHEQDAFWEYHDVLYEHQQALEIGQLQGYAKELGLNMTVFNECFIPEATKELVEQDKQLGGRSGVRGTPTFFFNGRRVTGVLTPEKFAEEVKRELE